MLFRSTESLPVNIISNFISDCATFSSQIVACEVVILRISLLAEVSHDEAIKRDLC